MEWRRTTEILLVGSTILLPSEINPGKTCILKYKIGRTTRLGPDPTFNRSSQNPCNKIFFPICRLNARIGQVLAQRPGGCYPSDTAGLDQTAQMGQFTTQPRLQAKPRLPALLPLQKVVSHGSMSRESGMVELSIGNANSNPDPLEITQRQNYFELILCCMPRKV